MAAPYRGHFELRIILTFLVFTAGWIAVLVAGIAGAIPLSLGLVINTVLATTFYMPMHEAAHKNIWGNERRVRWGEDLVGAACSIPLGFDYFSHRSSHMRHHAHTNHPDRDPDHYTHGTIVALLGKWVAMVAVLGLLPLFRVAPAVRRFLPSSVRRSLLIDIGGRPAELALAWYWFLSHLALVLAFGFGVGLPALMLWYIPSRLSGLWLLFVFAWFPHHPAQKVGRYVDTRVAVFAGSTLLARGHDYHALHHLFPRVPHYRLPALWDRLADDLVARGVRTEGTAKGATGPIVWR